jgi:hypothetical protein
LENGRLIQPRLTDFDTLEVLQTPFERDQAFYNLWVRPRLASDVAFRVCFEGRHLLQPFEGASLTERYDGSVTVAMRTTDLEKVARLMLLFEGYVTGIRPAGLREAYHRVFPRPAA